MVPAYTIRPYQKSDLLPLAKLYEQTVRQWAPALYSPAQVEAWATSPHDHERFSTLLEKAHTFVAVTATQDPIGFSGVEPNGRIASLYIGADQTRQGIGSALLQHAIAYATGQGIGPLWSEASILSRPLFERHGFQVTEPEHVMFNGVEFKRWIVRLEP